MAEIGSRPDPTNRKGLIIRNKEKKDKNDNNFIGIQLGRGRLLETPQ